MLSIKEVHQSDGQSLRSEGRAPDVERAALRFYLAGTGMVQTGGRGQ